MHALSSWFVRNPVAANLLMLLVLVAGFFSLQSIRIEGFPALPPTSVSITTVYPGASAEQVDRGVSRRIEKALEGMPGIKKISSVSQEDLSTLMVQKVSGFDMNRFQNEIRARVDAIGSFPQLAERPVVARDEFNVEALLVQVYGDVDTYTLQKVARSVKAALQEHPAITKMTPFGLLPHEIRIEVDDSKLQAYGIAIDDVSHAIENASLDYHTGKLKSEAGNVVIRADRRAFNYTEFASIPLLTLSDGTRIQVKDVANVIDGFEEENLFARFQQKPSVGMQVFTSKKGHLIEVSDAAHEILENIRPQLPEGVEVDIWGEYSVYMKARLALLATNAWQGLLIVFVLLAVFLDFRLAFWVAMGVPISLAGTVVFMGDRFIGTSLNDLTTFGMIVVLGILVDDAIVVGESVFETRSMNKNPVEGTIQGVKRVSTATVFGCFTTIAAFYPLLLIDNEIAKIFANISLVVIVALLVSLIESKLVLPAHLAAVRIDGMHAHKKKFRLWQRIQSVNSDFLSFLNNRGYQPLLRMALRNRFATMVILLTVAVCVISMIFNGWVRTVFFPEVPGQIIAVNMAMKSGSSPGLTMKNVTTIEKAAEALNVETMKEFQSDKPPIARIMTAMTGPYKAEIYAELQNEKSRKLETMETLRRWRERVGTLEGTEELSFSGSFETGGGFIIELGARDEAVLRDAVERFTMALYRIDGLYNIRHDFRQGEPQIMLHLKPEAQHLGLTTADLAHQVGDAFGGLEIQRLQRMDDEVKVLVTYKEQKRRYMLDMLDMQIRTNRGVLVPLTSVATIETGYVPSSMHRHNGRRVVQISASLDRDRIGSGEAFRMIKATIAPELTSLYPGLTIRGAGELEEMGEIKGDMKGVFVMILILIYALLAVPLKSYWQPLVIMSVIPFGFVGATIGHAVSGFPLSIVSFFGMLALMGVVVNNSLVLLTRFNEMHRDGTSVGDALVLSGGSRFRAIILTTVTTVCGLTPLLSETSEQAQYLIPAAISIAWGVLFTAPITLFIVPVLISLSHDFNIMMMRGELSRILYKNNQNRKQG